MSRSFAISLTLFHVILGFVIAQNTEYSFYFGLVILLFAIIQIIYNRNANDEACYWAAYVVGLEILLRMTGGSLVWEAGKYAVIFILLIGQVIEKIRKPYPAAILVYGFLLLPSLAVTNFPDFLHFRRDVSFNLSGPLTLIISVIYFYRRSYSSISFFRIIKTMVLPLISVVTYLFLVTPELTDIEYGTQSNFQASAGFGPNQVSIMMGLGILLIGASLYYKKSITGFIAGDVVLLLIFIVRGLVTFSRGGMIGGVVALTLLVGFNIFFGRKILSVSKMVIYSLVGLVIFFLTWRYVNDVSENRLQYRYQGINFRTGAQKDITSGRLLILDHELELFRQNPFLGIGPGMVREVAIKGKGFANTHSEYSRTLAEHGMFGIAALLILLIFPLRYILRNNRELYPILFPILFIVFFTMFHSAMRLAMPGFLYGLVFISAMGKKLPLHKSSQ